MIGEQVSKYVVIEEIGRGGMGVVYRAHDPDLRRDVALKVLVPDQARDGRRQRKFVEEARAASSLNHPGIVTVFDVVHHFGSDVMVMELIPGRSLRSEIQRLGELPWRRALEVGLRISEAMAAAHRGGLVHRDLKPENVMLVVDGRVKVLDFGLAKLDPVVSPDPDDDLATRVSSFEAELGAGTVSYMAPEQALGEAVDAQSDIFAFGVILYEMITGRRPFRGPTALATLQATVFEPPAALACSRDLPPQVSRLIGDCLEKKPSNRPQDFAAIIRVLEPCSQGSGETAINVEPVAPASWPKSTSAKPWRQPLGLVAGLVTSLAVLVAWGWHPYPEARMVQRPGQVQTLFSESEAPRLALAYPSYLEGQRLLERYDRPGHIDQAIEVLSEAIDLDDHLAVGYAALSEAFWRKYRVENTDSMWLDRAESHAQRALELDEHLAVSHIAMARVAVERNQIEAADAALLRAAMLDPLNVWVPLIRGRAAEKVQDLDGAEVAYNAAIEIDPANREVFDSLGSLLFQRARYQAAETAFRQSIAVAPDSYIGYRNLAGALQMQGRHDEAASQLQRSLEIRPTWTAYTNLGTLQFFRGLYGEAVSAFEQAIDLGANGYIAWANLGDSYRFSPVHNGEAPAAYRRAIQLANERLAGVSTDVELRSRIALYHAKSGDPEAALVELGKIELEAADATLLSRAVSIFELAGKRRSALQTLERALDLGYPIAAIEEDPELEALRRDSNYHRFMALR